MSLSRSVVRVVLAVPVLLVLFSVVPTLLGWRADVVMTGSMMPTLAPGDVVLSRPADGTDVANGAVALVRNPARPGTTLVHRVVRRTADGSLITRGDANPVEDSTPVDRASVLGLPSIRVPYVGLPLVWWAEGSYRALAGTVAVALVLALAGGERSRPGRHRAGGTAVAASFGPTGRSSAGARGAR
ncbi:signal peptidase I [Actinoplanes sp. NPDC049265]|uniref:signal peptidase I n=1 Tax=Actinoplanes sp. NPDC049265 TaxID=3363902 RepID=UPI00371C5E34